MKRPRSVDYPVDRRRYAQDIPSVEDIRDQDTNSQKMDCASL